MNFADRGVTSTIAMLYEADRLAIGYNLPRTLLPSVTCTLTSIVRS